MKPADLTSDEAAAGARAQARESTAESKPEEADGLSGWVVGLEAERERRCGGWTKPSEIQYKYGHQVKAT
jgi:hypothetical protein